MHMIIWMDFTGTMLNEEVRHKRVHTVYKCVCGVYMYMCTKFQKSQNPGYFQGVGVAGLIEKKFFWILV